MNRPTEQDWDMMVFCQKIAHAVRKSDNLRLPSQPEVALERMKQIVAAPRRQDGAA